MPNYMIISGAGLLFFVAVLAYRVYWASQHWVPRKKYYSSAEIDEAATYVVGMLGIFILQAIWTYL